MKRTLLTITKVILFTVGFLCAIYMFIPWREAGKFAVTAAQSQLQKRGMRLNYSDIFGEDGGFTVNNLKLSGMADVSMTSLTVKPDIVSSILSLSPVCGITFRGANIRLGMTMNFGDGGFLLTAGNEILLEDLHTNGEFSLDGYMTLDLANMKIARANAKMSVPEVFSQNMGMLRNFLPIVQEGGTWYLRRE